MVVILLGLLFGVHAGEFINLERPLYRGADKFTEIYLDPAERRVTGSRFESVTEKGPVPAACDCQGICGFGRGYKGHLIFGHNKKNETLACSICGRGQYNPSPDGPGKKDQVVYCYDHVCNEGYVSICDQSKLLPLYAKTYHRSHRACTCAKAAGRWQRVPGNFADNTITTGTTGYAEYIYAFTKTHTVAIESSVSYGIEIEGIGASSTLTMAEALETAIENSWMSGSSSTKEIIYHCDSGEGKDTAWQYTVYFYDVLCASNDRSKRYEPYSSGGCAISSVLMSEDGTTCTTSASEPPCCGPGENPTGVNERKFCEDDYASWTGQCDTWSRRTRWQNIEDGRINCRPSECKDLTDAGLRDNLSTCGTTCGNSAYANVFLPSHVYNKPNMLRCTDDSIAWIEKWLQTTGGYCKAVRPGNHVVALVSRDCARLGYGQSGVDFDSAYENAERDIGKWIATDYPQYSILDFLPVYYNNWAGVNHAGLCDGHMSRRLLETGDEPENCKCDPYCHKWGDCCNACAKEMEESHPSEFMSREEMEILGPMRSSMSEEEYEEAYEHLLQSETSEDLEQVSLGVKNKELKKRNAALQKLLLNLSEN